MPSDQLSFLENLNITVDLDHINNAIFANQVNSTNNTNSGIGVKCFWLDTDNWVIFNLKNMQRKTSEL
jgi:hypothetical protein